MKRPRPISFPARAGRYARAVVAGKVSACSQVKAACARHLADLKRPNFPYKFDPGAASRVCEAIELLPHIKGKWAGTPIQLEDWQVFILACVFGWLRKADGLRRFRLVYIEVPRKNGKSLFSAAVGLFGLALDGEMGAEIYSAATTRDQAKIVFCDAQEMARKSADFQRACGVEVLAHLLVQPRTGSKFAALSAEDNTLDGLNSHVAIIDELHAHRTRGVYDVLETSTGARSQPLLWIITTAGVNRAGICYEVRNYVSKVLAGTTEDETVFGTIYTIDEGDDPFIEATWRKANPNYGVSIEPDDLARKAKKAQWTPSALNNFLTKHLNVWVNAGVAWLDPAAWARCGRKDLTLEECEGRPLFVALDLATKVDIAAMILLFPPTEAAPKWALFGRFFLPEAAIEGSANSQYAGWAREGHLITTPGNVLDFERIAEEMRGLPSRFDVREVPFDPFQAMQFSTQMLAEGFPMVEMGATVKNFSEPMKQLEALVMSQQLEHDGDPVMAWMVSNVIAHLDAKENTYPRRETSANKIDGAVAAIMALGRAMTGGVASSVYEDRGVVVLGEEPAEVDA